MKINLNYNIKKAMFYTKLALSSKKQNLFQGIILIVFALAIDFVIYHAVYNLAQHHIYTISKQSGIDLIVSLGFFIIGVGLVLKSFTNK